MTEIAHAATQSTDIVSRSAALTPLPSTGNASVDQLLMHAQHLAAIKELCKTLCASTLVPKIYQATRDNPAAEDNAAAAMLYGSEIGLNGVQSLQQVFVVHGTPSIYARTMVALVKSRGYNVYTVESTDESVTVEGTSPDGLNIETSTWGIDRATRAGYVPEIDPKTGEYRKNKWGKLDGNEKYLKDPQAMLYAKAAAEVCRKLAPEVLLGIPYTIEEMELEGPRDGSRKIRSERIQTARGTAGARAALGLTTREDNPADAQAGTEPTAAPENPAESTALATKTQITAITTAMKNVGMTDKDSNRAWVNQVIGHDATLAELTRTEADLILGELDKFDGPAE